MMTLAAMTTAPACPMGGMGGGIGGTPRMRAPAGMGGGGLGMPNLSLTSFTRRAGSFAGVSAPLGGLHDRRAVVAGGGPAAQQAVRAALTKRGTPYVWGVKGATTLTAPG